MPLIFKEKILAKCNLTCVRSFCTTGYERLDKILFSDEIDNSTEKPNISKQSRARAIKVVQYFTNEPHLKDIKRYIPSKYFLPKRRLSVQHLYLADKQIARSVVSHMMPFMRLNKEQIVCETNPGLGLITSELLENEVELVRLYETCAEFRQLLKDFNAAYPNRVELFVKDIFHLGSLSSMDKYDSGDRVEQLLKGVPKRSWTDDPVMTIVGPMPNTNFINYLLRMLATQREIMTYGRIQIFALMKPTDYFKFTAHSGMSLHIYQAISILFQLLFECQLLEKYPRKSFLPWETKPKANSRAHSQTSVDIDYIYLVRINLRKNIPVKHQHLLHLYYFIKQGFLRGKPKVIPSVEKWLPGIGAYLIAPGGERRAKSFLNINIYTEFGHLNPTQILQIFLEMLEHPEYESSPFMALIESQMLKYETIESDLADRKSTRHIENLKENIS